MVEAADILWGGVMPAIVAGATLAAVFRLTKNAASAWRTAFVVGFVAGLWALDARSLGVAEAITKSMQPTEAKDWLPLLLILAIVPDAIACVGKYGSSVAWVLRIGLSLLTPWLILRGSAYLPAGEAAVFASSDAWTGWEAAAWLGALAALLVVGWLFVRLVDNQSAPRIRSTLAAFVAFGGAMALALSGSFTYGLLMGLLTAVLAGCGLGSALMHTTRGPDASAGPLIVVTTAVLIMAHFYATLTLLNAVLLLVAMVLAVGWLPGKPNQWPKAQQMFRILLCVATVGIAASLAGIEFARTQSETSTNPYEALK